MNDPVSKVRAPLVVFGWRVWRRDWWRGIVGSFHYRTTAALILIGLGMVGQQFVSQQRALQLRQESEAYRQAVALSDKSRALTEAVATFRIDALALTLPRSALDTERGRDLFTEDAIAVDSAANDISAALAGGATGIVRWERLTDLDAITGPVLALEPGKPMPPAARRRLEHALRGMADTVAEMDHAITARRADAFANLAELIDGWHVLVGLLGALVMVPVLGISFDVLFNILPALRQVHRALQRLAGGDLDVTIEPSRLTEVNGLAGALETFRRNARAVSGLAFTDPGSELPNRRAFMDRLDAVLADPRAGDHLVMLADVDRFKYINDDYGHAVGDCLIRLIGRRLCEALGDAAMVARLGGDEFALLIPLGTAESAAALAARIVALVGAEPFACDSTSVRVTLSAGYVVSHGDARFGWKATSAPDVLLRADLALYASKHGGRNGATGFRDALLADHEIERALERDLAEALRRDEVRMVYQPIHPVAGDPHEVEALVRWDHPAHGSVPPSRFIPAAERSGMMTRLGDWIVERALSDLAAWPGIGLSLNLSPLQLQQEQFVGRFLDSCRRHGIAPQRLCLEVTESISIERNRRALLSLELLRQAGCRIALDDFGTGYSSLSLLRGFPFDRLKLDRELIVDLAHDERSRAVFDAAVSMARRIGAQVVAEGIGEAALLGPAEAAGCTHLQGFYFSRPLEAAAVPGYFAQAEAKVA
ncbi:putative bifunctional diguanylate cyclase/phosphodiesterase [Novosphingobium huizhouense]|uniref:putative bifunctional diguanylate cyclase/phosphodiesterase n=1 Tax=Novosphingobium huizhouense TaxID=2866625 RepID=UPI001CD81D2D|nr:GGDEF domain-containing phosphodiesterase [Novosphingobium huizhouense]